MLYRCPKCGHRPLPQDQASPAACPGCGVILAKVVPARRAAAAPSHVAAVQAVVHVEVADEPDSMQFWFRAVLLGGFLIWGARLIFMDYRTGEIAQSFIHGPLLIFHEAGHVVFRIFGHWVSVLGGTLGQLVMPLILGIALLWKNRDPFGAAIGLWLFGVSVLDVAPYMFDALHPQLMLLSGSTGEAGGHDWIYLFDSMGLLKKSQTIGAVTHAIGALIVVASMAWAARVLIKSRDGTRD
jgi:DNA-directed RNA polymerase subunit RPC12/RpoP